MPTTPGRSARSAGIPPAVHSNTANQPNNARDLFDLGSLDVNAYWDLFSLHS